MKRLDKLLDFEWMEEKMLDVGSVTYDGETAWHTYQVLNSLLVADTAVAGPVDICGSPGGLQKASATESRRLLGPVKVPSTLALGSCGLLCKASHPSSSF